MKLRNDEIVDMVERNHYGAWVIYGELGIMQYYYYTEKKRCGNIFKSTGRNIPTIEQKSLMIDIKNERK